MSRIFTISVILLLMAVVVLVPRIGTEETGPDLGDGYAYREDTLARLRLLLEEPTWNLSDPPRNQKGMLEAVHEKTGLTFVLIPAGEFWMGSTEDEQRESRSHDEDLHKVRITHPFLLGKTECTQEAWDKVGGKDARRWRDPDLPVEGVSWMDVKRWCRRAGGRLRLPSEAEWEYSCRAGTYSPFWTGDVLTTVQANFDGSSLFDRGYKGHNRRRTVKAGSMPPNPWGLHEVHGNVAEWCYDFRRSRDDSPSDGSYVTDEREGFLGRPVRGGSWKSWGKVFCRSADRGRYIQGVREDFLGFRPAADLPEAE